MALTREGNLNFIQQFCDYFVLPGGLSPQYKVQYHYSFRTSRVTS